MKLDAGCACVDYDTQRLLQHMRLRVNVNVKNNKKPQRRCGHAVETPSKRSERLALALIFGGVYVNASRHSPGGGALVLVFGKLETFNTMRS